jgi:C1A family cysteine protease
MKKYFLILCFFPLFILQTNQKLEAQNITETTQTYHMNLDGLPPIGNQVVGGSCFAWAAAYYYLTHLQWQEYGWDVNDPTHQCSPAFVYNLTNGGVDNGASEGINARADAFKVFETMGCATMADMPYDFRAYQTFPSENAFRNGKKFRTLKTHRIELNSIDGINELKNHLLNSNIAVIGILGYSNLDNIRFYENTYCKSQITGHRLYWHEVTVVGFDDSKRTADGKGAFYIANSWGSGWGDNGFFWMSYQAVMDSKTSYRYALYAIDRIDYEPSLIARIMVSHSDRYNLIYKAGYGDVSSPDTLLTFFDFSPMSLRAGVAYPQTPIILDLTDLYAFVFNDASNDIFLQIKDNRTNNDHSGLIQSVIIEDKINELAIGLSEVPIDIPDLDVETTANIQLDYSFSTPSNCIAELDTIIGSIELAWQPPSDLSNFINYRIYCNGVVIDSTKENHYAAQLPQPGDHFYGISAKHQTGESLQTFDYIFRPLPFGIPFSDEFENGLTGWLQAGNPEIDAVINLDTTQQRNHIVALQSNLEDYSALLRLFSPSEGITFETCFKLQNYPVNEQGFAGGVWLSNQFGQIFGVSINNHGQPNIIYPVSELNHEIGILDSTLTIDLNEWYQHKAWYNNGIFHTIILNENWDVILNKRNDVINVFVDRIGLIAWGLDGGWNYFDNFSAQHWQGFVFEHFIPVMPTNKPYALVINEALLSGEMLKPGDEIGVFDGLLCVGAATVSDNFPFVFNVWENNIITPGFTPDHEMEFVLWQQKTNLEYNADVTYEVGDGKFKNGLFSRCSLIGTNITNVQTDYQNIPQKYSISSAYPNPFNPTTTIRLSLPKISHTRVNVYNIIGQKVATLTNKKLDAGNHKIIFDGKNLPSGIYVIHSEIEGQIINSNKVLLMK